jgi:hypothetical protein
MFVALIPLHILLCDEVLVDVSYAALQAHEIFNVALH